MAEETIRVGIIGAGKIAEHHLKVLSSFNDVTIAAIANRGSESRDKIKKEFNISADYGDFNKMLQKEHLDAIFILVNAENMMAVTEQCLEYSLPILMEKPPGLTKEETKRLAEKAERKNVPVMVGLNRRFYSIYIKAIVAIKERGPLLGIAVHAPERIAEEKAGGAFGESVLEQWLTVNGIHCLDLLLFFGGRITNLYTVKNAFREKNGDNFGALIKFTEGAIGHYSSHWNSPGRWTVDLYGDGIRAHFEPLENGVLLTSDHATPNVIEPDQEDLDYKPGLWRQNRYFIDRVKDKKPISYPAASIEEAVLTMGLVEEVSSAS